MNSTREIVVWIARTSSLVSLLLLFAFIFGGQESEEFINSNEIIGFLCFPIGIIVGMITAWLHERSGGLIGVLSLIAFYAWHFNTAGHLPTGPWFLIFSLPVFIFLAASFFPAHNDP